MPIGYNPDVINPGGIDYAELTDLVNPPNAANAGKTIVINENGKPTLGEGGGGGGGSIGVLYSLDIDPLTTDAAIPDGAEEVSNTAVPVGLTADAETPMDYAALVSYFETHDLIRVYVGDGVYYVECSRVVYDEPQLGSSGYRLFAAIGPYEFFDGDVARFGVMFTWADK